MFNRIIEYSNQVAKKLGKGFSETVYHEALCAHLRSSSFTYNKEQIVPVTYRIEDQDYVVGNVRADIVLPDNDLIIECKAIEGNLRSLHIPQIIVYLNLLKYNNGILINFNQNPSKDLVEHITITRKDDCYIVNGGEETFSKTGAKIT